MNTFILPVLFGSFLYAIQDYITKLIQFRNFKGPFPLPLLGNLYDPKATSIISYLNSCMRTYGPIFAFWAGSKPIIVISEPCVVRKILTDTTTFVKGPDYTEKFSVVFGKGLVTSNGEKHKKDRACLGHFFTKTHIAKYHEMICHYTDQMIEEEIVPNLGKIVNLQDFFHILSLRIFGFFSSQKDYSLPENRAIAKKINTGVKEGSNIIGTHIILNLPMFSFLPSIRKVKKIVEFVDRQITKEIHQRNKMIQANYVAPDDILSTLVLRSPENIDDIREHIRTALAAGHDTTAFFGCYMV